MIGKKYSSVMATAILFTSVLSGCGGNKPNEPAATSAADTSATTSSATATSAPNSSGASSLSPAVQQRLSDPNIPASQKEEIRKHMQGGN